MLVSIKASSKKHASLFLTCRGGLGEAVYDKVRPQVGENGQPRLPTKWTTWVCYAPVLRIQRAMVFVKRTLSMNMIRSHMLAIRIPLDIELKKKIIVYQY